MTYLIRRSLWVFVPALFLACGGDSFELAESPAAGAGGATGGGGGEAGSAGSAAGSGGGDAGVGGSVAGSGGSDAGSAGSETGGGGGEAGAGGSVAGSGGSDAGAGGNAAGSGGGDAGAGGNAAGSGGGEAGAGGSVAGSGGGEAGAGGSVAGSGGSDAGAGGSDAGSGGSDAGAGGSAAGSGGDAGAGGSDAGAGGSDAGAGGSGGATGDTVYVSATGGDDEFSGFSVEQPKKTVEAALALAKATPGVKEIKLCRGVYGTSATLEIPAGLSMTGGYACSTFQDPTVYTAQAYCVNSVDSSLLTTIQGPGVSPVVRLVAGAGSSALRGLDILAQRTGVEMVNVSASMEQSRVRIDPTFFPTEPSVALLVQGGSPKIKDTCLKGGPGLTAVDAGEQSFPGSTGVGVFLNGAPELTFSVIEGGSGDGGNKGVGSVGVFSRNSSPILRNNSINGGKGTSSKLAASVGVLIQSTGGAVSVSRPDIKDNGNIDGGEGTQVAGGRGSVGLLLRCLDAGGGCAGIDVSGDRAISKNFVSGGKGKHPGLAQAEVQTGVWYHGGANFEAASVIDLIDNRISGGTTSGGSPPTKPGPVALDLTYARGKIEKNSILGGQFNADSATGIRLVRSKNLRLVNNMIHGGILSSSSNSALRGIVFSEAQQLTIAHNTLLMGSGAAVGRGITMLAEDTNSPIPTGSVRIDNNLVLGNKDPHYGVELQSCPAGRLISFQGNGFVHLGGRAVFTNYDPASCVGNKVLSVGNFIKGLSEYCSLSGGNGSACGSLPANLGGNIGMSALCSDEVECTAIPGCIGFNECAQVLFQINQSSNEALVSELLTGTNRGWKLRGNLPCSAVESPFAPSFVVDDRYSVSRSSPHARGAHEQNTCVNANPGG